MKTIRKGFALAAMAVAPWASAAVSDGTDCGGFTTAKAAAWLRAPPAQVTREVAKAGDKWVCTFAVGKSQPAIAFSMAVAPNARRSEADMDKYRDRLYQEAASARWKNKLPNGVYGDMFGVGDEALWTDIESAYTVRSGNVIVQVSVPKAKDDQVRLGKAVVDGF
jgi:hypothetical protein